MAELKVLFVGLRWDYKDPARGDSFEYANFWLTLSNMPDVEAQLFGFDEVEAELGRQGMNAALIETVGRFMPDIVFFLLFEDEFSPETLRRLRKMVPTINWFADDQWRFTGFSRHWAPQFSWVATTTSRAADAYRNMGLSNVIETQWACNHFLYGPRDVERDLDVTFVGQPHSERRGVIEGIRMAGYRVDAWGHGWESGRLTQEEMIETFSRSKVNLNLSNVSRGWGARRVASLFLRRRGKFVVPDWGNIKQNLSHAKVRQTDAIKGRNFEIPGCRALLLTNEVPSLDRYYVPGEEIVTFDGFDDLIAKVDRYLHSDDEREQIAQAGYERTLREHTYEIRFREIFDKIGLKR